MGIMKRLLAKPKLTKEEREFLKRSLENNKHFKDYKNRNKNKK